MVSTIPKDSNESTKIVPIRTVTQFVYAAGIELKLGDKLVFGNRIHELVSQVDEHCIVTLFKSKSELIGLQSYLKRSNPDGSKFLELELSSEFDRADPEYTRLDSRYQELNSRARST